MPAPVLFKQGLTIQLYVRHATPPKCFGHSRRGDHVLWGHIRFRTWWSAKTAVSALGGHYPVLRTASSSVRGCVRHRTVRALSGTSAIGPGCCVLNRDPANTVGYDDSADKAIAPTVPGLFHPFSRGVIQNDDPSPSSFPPHLRPGQVAIFSRFCPRRTEPKSSGTHSELPEPNLSATLEVTVSDNDDLGTFRPGRPWRAPTPAALFPDQR